MSSGRGFVPEATGIIQELQAYVGDRYDSGYDDTNFTDKLLQQLEPGRQYTTTELAKAIGIPHENRESARKAMQRLVDEGKAARVRGEILHGPVRAESLWHTIPGPATDPFHPRDSVFDTGALASCLGYTPRIPMGLTRVVHICADD